MSRALLFFLLMLVAICKSFAQNYHVTVLLKDADNREIPSAVISLPGGNHKITDLNGVAQFHLSRGKVLIEITHAAFEASLLSFFASADTTLVVRMHPKLIALNEVNISASRAAREPLLHAVVDNELLTRLRGNTLISKLEFIPGVSSSDIGQGFSKPVIRGLTANRVAVTENGIKQQGQQWGMDHGLEIDPYAVGDVTIIKGPASLEYGSDAIGGVVAITPRHNYGEGLMGSAVLNAASGNGLLGVSAAVANYQDKYFLQSRVSYQSYGDYQIPADSFEYLGYKMPLYDKRLKNTAGRDLSLMLGGGCRFENHESILTISNVFGKMGFFPGAHGIPGGLTLEPDGNNRNIDFPYQSVNHLKLILNHKIHNPNNSFWSIDAAYQYNHRQEYAYPHSHGTTSVPQSNLELDLKLHTITGSVKWRKYINSEIDLTSGINVEFQKNAIGGYSFLLPAFSQQMGGLFAILNWQLNSATNLRGGLRYDGGHIRIRGYKDHTIIADFQRAVPLNRIFGNVSFTLGMSHQLSQQWNVKLNVGRSFRMPTANELSSNGVHHGTFRYEQGDPSLNPETAYQGDASVQYTSSAFRFNASSFATYFDNYVYLDPTGRYSVTLPDGQSILLPDVGQIYQYKSGRTFRWGGELDISFHPLNWLAVGSSGEYVWAKDIEHHYPIPFTPPLRINSYISFTYNNLLPMISGGDFSISHSYAAAQKRIRNEDFTPSSSLFNLLLTSNLRVFHNMDVKLILGINNLFNTRYYNHISFYRNLSLPEPGRNMTITLLFNYK